MFSVFISILVYTDAGIVWSSNVYGHCIIERNAVYRQNFYHVYATKISARLHLSATCSAQKSSYIHCYTGM